MTKTEASGGDIYGTVKGRFFWIAFGAVLGVLCNFFPMHAQAESRFKDDCLYISWSIFMCDEKNDWVTLELPEDLEGIGFDFGDGITAQIEGIHNPLVGIQVRLYKPDSRNNPRGTIEELTRIDGYPVITRISPMQINGTPAMRAQTTLLLHQFVLTAETYQDGGTYTAEHAARHEEILRGITHEWSFQ